MAAMMIPGLASARVGGISSFGGSVELATALGHQRVTSASSRPQKTDQARIEEKVTLDLGGFAVGPGFLTFDLGGTAGMRQDWLDTTGADVGFGNGRLLEYNARAVLLPVLPVSLALFGSRFDDQALRNFGTDTKAQGESLGGTLVLGNRFFPATFTYQRLNSRTENRGGLEESRREELRQLMEFSGSYFSEQRQIRIRARDEDVEDDSQPSVGDYHVREADGSFGFRWGPYFEKSLRASGRYFERRSRNFERGSETEFQNISGSSGFRWDLTEDLVSQISYDINRFESTERDELAAQRFRQEVTTSHKGIFSLEHQFYESIKTGLRSFGDLVDQDDGGSLAYGGGASLNYRKRLPWNSRVLADLGVNYRIEDVEAHTAPLMDTAEELTVEQFTGVFLENTRVDRRSIQVFDASSNQELAVGIDYIAIEIGSRTSIEPLPGGSIQLGDRLTVRYSYQTDPDVRTGTLSQSYGIGWDLRWLLIRYDHSQIDEELLDGQIAGDLQKSRRDSVRLELRRQLESLRVSATSQYTHDVTARSKFDEYGLGQRLSWAPRRNLDLEARFGESWRTFVSPDRRRTATFRAGASLSWRFSTNRRMRLFIDHRFNQNSETEDQSDLELGADGRITFGRIEVIPSLSWLWRERGASELQDLRGTLLIRRRF
jgi:hypothetical protein